MDTLVSAARVAEDLKALGAPKVLAIGAIRGIGDLPDPEVVTCLCLDVRAEGGLMEGLRFMESALENLPPAVTAHIEAFDPDQQAWVVRSIFSSDHPIAGRPVFGGRPEAWQCLEDKMIVDDLWDAASVPRAPRRLVGTTLDELKGAHNALNRGKGTVWVGDNHSGWHGGAQLLRWVRTADEMQEAQHFLAQYCEQIRVMPFLEGIPCSIHGWIFEDQIISLRPCEMLVFQMLESNTFSYAGSATSWSPLKPVGLQMKQAALRVGDHLRSTVDYRGSFTVDGVVTSDGFYPTELNPRFGGALGRMKGSLTSLPIYLLHLATAHGGPLDYRPDELERLIEAAVEKAPVVRAMQMLDGRFDIERRKFNVVKKQGYWRIAGEDEEAGAKVVVGDSATGTLIWMELKPHAIRRGESNAPELIELMAALSSLLNLDLKPMRAAVDAQRMNLSPFSDASCK
jgi:hypothetical protein